MSREGPGILQSQGVLIIEGFAFVLAGSVLQCTRCRNSAVLNSLAPAPREQAQSNNPNLPVWLIREAVRLMHIAPCKQELHVSPHFPYATLLNRFFQSLSIFYAKFLHVPDAGNT